MALSQGPLWGWFSDDSLKFMFTALFLASELLYLYRDTDSLRWGLEIGDFFKAVPDLQERCGSAAHRTGRQLQVHIVSEEGQAFLAVAIFASSDNEPAPTTSRKIDASNMA
jgi:hypothetical protein